MGLLGLESSEGPRLLAVIPGTSRPLYLGFFWVSWKGKEIHIPQSETFRLVCAERSHFFQRNLKQKQYCGCLKSRNVQYPHLERVSPTHSESAARWLSMLLESGGGC